MPAETRSDGSAPRADGGTVVAPDAGAAEDVAALEQRAMEAFDAGNHVEARQIAGRALAVEPANVRMLRLAASASCIAGDAADIDCQPPDG